MDGWKRRILALLGSLRRMRPYRLLEENGMSSNHPPGSADPLHGVTLKALLEWLVEHYGWDELGRRGPINCFLHEPSMNSSLKFLRRTPWAREKVEALYIAAQR